MCAREPGLDWLLDAISAELHRVPVEVERIDCGWGWTDARGLQRDEHDYRPELIEAPVVELTVEARADRYPRLEELEAVEVQAEYGDATVGVVWTPVSVDWDVSRWEARLSTDAPRAMPLTLDELNARR